MPLLELYAPEKGRYARWIVAVCTILLLASGCYTLYYGLPEGARKPVMGWMPLGAEFPVSWALLSSTLVLVAGACGTWWVINYKRFVDFLHDTEVEMGKVSWASKDEVTGSSVVVCLTTLVLAVWLYIVDIALIGVRELFGG